MSLLFKLFLSCPFSEVTSIFFAMEDRLAFLPSDPKFISLLSSVNDMERFAESLFNLARSQPRTMPLSFRPSRSSIHLPLMQNQQQKSSSFGLVEVDEPSNQCLIIGSQYFLEAGMVDLSSLEQFSGLMVVWTTTDPKSLDQTSEYLCGSAPPEQLDFRVVKVNIARSWSTYETFPGSGACQLLVSLSTDLISPWRSFEKFRAFSRSMLLVDEFWDLFIVLDVDVERNIGNVRVYLLISAVVTI